MSVFALKQRYFLSFQKINLRLHVAFLIRFCPSTRKRHSDRQQYHLMGACPYNGLSVRDVILLKSRRRQRERQKKKKVYIRKNNNSARAAHFLVHFFAVTARLRREIPSSDVLWRT